MKVAAILAVIVVVWMAAGGEALVYECGRQGGYKICPNGQCCSQWGFCGYTKEYCGIGCQSSCRCGSKFDDAPCKNGQCCSQWGHCGSNKDYCCSGCQGSNCWGFFKCHFG